MKKFALIGIALLILSAVVLAEVKIGVINAQQVIQQTQRGKEITGRLESLGQEKQKRVDGMREEIKKLQQDLASPAINEQTRERKSQELQDKQTRLKRFIEDAQREMQTKSQRELSKLREEILPIIQKIGKEKGFTMILDLSIAGIAYFDQAIDITGEVISAYDQQYPSAQK